MPTGQPKRWKIRLATVRIWEVFFSTENQISQIKWPILCHTNPLVFKIFTRRIYFKILIINAKKFCVTPLLMRWHWILEAKARLGN